MLHFNATLLRAVDLFKSKDPTRYYLHGIHIEPCDQGGAIAVATNGHVMMAAHDPQAQCDGNIIVNLDKNALAACKTSRSDMSTNRRAYFEDGTCTTRQDLDDSDIASGLGLYETVDGTFPDWRRVLPLNNDGTYTPVFATEYLALFRKAAKELETKTVMIVTGDNGPALVKFTNESVVGAIMPVRSTINQDVPGVFAI